MKNVSEIVLYKAKQYAPSGGLEHLARFILALTGINHQQVKWHFERVALLAEAVAESMGRDKKAVFFAGLLHDTGKVVQPSELFDGHNVSIEEYERIKTHARDAFKIFENQHLFTALCAGLHHNLYDAGYGLGVNDFPKHWSPKTIKKVLEISLIISVCDYVDASHRKTIVKDSGLIKKTLREQLLFKFPDDSMVINSALKAVKRLDLYAPA